MTELEALKEAVFAAQSTMLHAGSPPAILHWTEVKMVISTLIEQVEQAEADPSLAANLAEAVMAENGVYVTATFDREWFDQVVHENAIRALTPDETAALLTECLSSVTNASEQTMDTIDFWLNEHINVHKKVKI